MPESIFRRRCLVAAALLFFTLVSCGPRSQTASTEEAAGRAMIKIAHEQAADGYNKPAPTDPARQRTEGSAADSLGSLAAPQTDRYLIKTASLTLECEDTRAATTQLLNQIQTAGGYVSNLNESADAIGRRSVTVEVRVPSDRLDGAMSQFESLGKILNKHVTTQDVTEEYVDTDARSRNLKRTEERLLDHLNRAGVLEDVLRVEQELTRVREQIELLDGRLRFLGHRVAFSAISITLVETAKAQPVLPAKSFSTAKEFSVAVRALITFLQAIWTRIIWILVWFPIWLPPVLVPALVYRRTRRAR